MNIKNLKTQLTKENDESIKIREVDILTDDQKLAFTDIKEWLMNSDENYKTLSGYAGTGKTFLIDFIVNFAKSEGLKTIVTATTNKAVKVLRSKVTFNKFSTIHSLLNIKAKKIADKEVFEPITYGKKQDINEFDLVIIDECSMVSKKLLKIINDQLSDRDIFDDYGTKVLFVGDPAQLQPINETVSKTFKFNSVHLNEIVRHGDIIANKSKILRSTPEYIPFTSLLSDPEIRRTEKNDLKELFKGFRENPDKYRFLTWRNVSVDKWNRTLRIYDYGYIPKDDFNIGDVIIANSPCEKNMESVIMMNSQEAIVKNVMKDARNIEVTDTKDVIIRYNILEVITDEGQEVTLNVVDNEDKRKLDSTLKKIAKLAKEKKLSWQHFWFNKKFFHDITHCYAMTTHKSQGSSFENVIIHTSDYDLNKDTEERNQLAYVGITRAMKSILLY